MNPRDDLTLDCTTCLAANTTACSDCIVTHLLANDDGPIELRPVQPAAVVDVAAVAGEHDDANGGIGWDVERVVERFVSAGLADDPPAFVTVAEFERAGSSVLVGAHPAQW